MKKLFLILLAVISITSCVPHYVTLKNIPDDEYKNYLLESSYSNSYSPIAYSVIRGNNPANEYTWVEVRLVTFVPRMFHHYCYQGNFAELIQKAYPECDVIMAYGSSYFIGTKIE